MLGEVGGARADVLAHGHAVDALDLAAQVRGERVELLLRARHHHDRGLVLAEGDAPRGEVVGGLDQVGLRRARGVVGRAHLPARALHARQRWHEGHRREGVG